MISKTNQNLILSLLITIFFTTSGCTNQIARYHLRKGEAYWRNGNTYSAIKELRKALKYEPLPELKENTLVLLATISEGVPGEYETALWAFRERLKLPLSPEDKYEIYTRIGEIFSSDLKDYKKSIDVYRELISLIPNNIKEPDVRLEISKNFLNLGEYQLAEKEAREIISLFPRAKIAPNTIYQLGTLAYLQAKYVEGRKYFNEVIKNFPNSSAEVYAWLGIANCFEEEDDLKNAILTFRSIKQKFPNQDTQDTINQRIAILEKRIQKRGR